MLSVLVGVAVGMATGLVPGLHLNSFLPVLFFMPEGVGFAIGVAISHSFFDFIPSVFLGVPDEASALSVLPAHRLVLQGNGIKAFRLTVIGGLTAALAAIIALPLLFIAAPLAPLLREITPLLLAAALAFLLLDSRRRLLTLVAMVLSTLAGLTADTMLIMPLLAGFFGVSTIVHSLRSRDRLPPQRDSESIALRPRAAVLAAAFALPTSLLPGVSVSISGAMAKAFGRMDTEEFLAALGGINTVYAFMAVLAIFVVGRPRSGAGMVVDAVGASLPEALGAILLALGVSAFLAWHGGTVVARFVSRADSRLLNIIALCVTITLVIVFTGPRGIIALATSSLIGYYCLATGVRRMACMASLIFPTILYYVL